MPIVSAKDARHLPIRFPPGMREELKSIAKANGRSMNTEVIARLEASMRQPTSAALDATVKAAIDNHVNALVQQRLREVGAALAHRT